MPTACRWNELKLVRFPARSPLPIAALPSMSLSPKSSIQPLGSTHPCRSHPCGSIRRGEPGATPPGIRLPPDNQALKVRVSSVCSFPIPYALVTLQTELALNLASRIEHAPSPQSSPRKRGEAEWCRVLRTYRRKTRVASCLPSPRSTSATRINYLKLNAC